VRAMIMAAGLGTRLWPLTGLIPKPMVPILNRPALYHILRLLRRHGVTEVVMNLHHFADTITSYFADGEWMGMELGYTLEEKLLGTAGGVKNNEAFLSEGTFLVMSGDALTDIDLTALVGAHKATGALATLAVKEVADPSLYGVVVTDSEGRIAGFQEKPSREQALSCLCNCGIYVFEPAVFDHIPAGSFYDFGSRLFPELLAAGERVYAHTVSGYWNDVGNLVEYRRGNFDALAGLVRVEMPGRQVEPGVWLGERTFVARTVTMQAPVLIGSDCRIEEDVVLEGPLVMGDQSLVEYGSSLRRAISWSGLFLGEGCRLADTVVGRSVHVRGRVQADGAVLGERSLVGYGRNLGARVLKPRAVVWR
jgi:NDP-sugar pyrophosphorylase family protein